MMRALYSLSIFFYGVAIRIAALFNSKARKWVDGRKDWRHSLAQRLEGNTAPVIWVHCASLGEFEQGRPLIEAFKKERPDHKILLSFFSPSGYEIRKKYEGADHVVYLPLDTRSNARFFIETVKPRIVLFVKYEFWLNFLDELRKNKIAHFLVSGIFREDQIFFKRSGKLFRQALMGFNYIFTQDTKSDKLLDSISIQNKVIAGDTRFDRVMEISEVSKDIAIASAFSGTDRNVLVAGSTWPIDEKYLIPAFSASINKGWRLMIAPHELQETHLVDLEKLCTLNGIAAHEVVRYSKADPDTIRTRKVLIIDNIGMLSSLYKYGKLAYVGGGFGKSIHNVLEAAVYGMPVVFGPRFEKFEEAKKLLALGGGRNVNDEYELKEVITYFIKEEEELKKCSAIAGEFVKSHCGATKIIMRRINEIINR